jgi:prophage tail gpP-like protein
MSKITLKIGNQEFYSFNKFTVGLNYNGVASVFSFDGYFKPADKDQRKLFMPLSYADCQVLFDGNPILTGTILNINTSANPEPTLNSISGYSKTGVLEDCEVPLGENSLQSDNLNLKEIAEQLLQPFGLKLVIDSVIQDVNTLYPENGEDTEGQSALDGVENDNYAQQNAKETETIKDYLSKLCIEKNIILTHNALGNLVFTRVKSDKKSIATYTENKPSTKISLAVDGQKIHSDITMSPQVSLYTDTANEETVTNSLVKVYRPTYKKQQTDTSYKSFLKDSAIKVRGSELRAIVLTIETNEWIWFDGKKNHMIKPNDIIDVISPQNFMNNRTSWFVEEVILKGDDKSSTAIINCVLPECYNGNEPKNVFA